MRARLERWLSPGLGTCYRCQRPWKSPAVKYLGLRGGVHHSQQLNRLRWWGLIGVEAHTTDYTAGRGCFPLCERCWADLRPSERLDYYNALVTEWERQAWRDYFRGVVAEAPDYSREWRQIRAAVMAGR